MKKLVYKIVCYKDASSADWDYETDRQTLEEAEEYARRWLQFHTGGRTEIMVRIEGTDTEGG